MFEEGIATTNHLGHMTTTLYFPFGDNDITRVDAAYTRLHKGSPSPDVWTSRVSPMASLVSTSPSRRTLHVLDDP